MTDAAKTVLKQELTAASTSEWVMASATRRTALANPFPSSWLSAATLAHRQKRMLPR